MATPTKKNQEQKTNDKAVKPLLNPELHYQIEKRAYQIWLSNGCSHGGDVANWLQAENEMLGLHQKNARQTV
jgi:Protein of unknown function (DUF2934)